MLVARNDDDEDDDDDLWFKRELVKNSYDVFICAVLKLNEIMF